MHLTDWVFILLTSGPMVWPWVFAAGALVPETCGCSGSPAASPSTRFVFLLTSWLYSCGIIAFLPIKMQINLIVCYWNACFALRVRRCCDLESLLFLFTLLWASTQGEIISCLVRFFGAEHLITCPTNCRHLWQFVCNKRVSLCISGACFVPLICQCNENKSLITSSLFYRWDLHTKCLNTHMQHSQYSRLWFAMLKEIEITLLEL